MCSGTHYTSTLRRCEQTGNEEPDDGQHGGLPRRPVIVGVLQVSEQNKSSQRRFRSFGTLGGHFEEFVDELILTPDVTSAQPPHLALPNFVYRLIALNRS